MSLTERLYLVTVGMPRSGTTLFASLLAAQPFARFVTDYLHTPLRLAERWGLPFDAPLDAAHRRAALLMFREELVRIGHVTLLSPQQFDSLRTLHERVLDELAAPEHRLSGHKMVVPPDMLPALLEQSALRLVMLYRDPRDAALSFWHRTGGGVEGYLRDWRKWIRLAESLRGHPRFLALRYESLVVDPHTALAPLVDRWALPIDWRGVSLHFERGPRVRVPLHANSAHDDVNTPLDTAPVGRWRTRPDDPIVRYADWRCRREIHRLGYPAHPTPRHAPRDVLSHARRALTEEIDQALQRALEAWTRHVRPRLAPPLRPHAAAHRPASPPSPPGTRPPSSPRDDEDTPSRE